MAQCRHCSHSGDCWIKARLEMQRWACRMDLTDSEEDIFLDASRGHCALFEDRETAEDTQFEEDD